MTTKELQYKLLIRNYDTKRTVAAENKRLREQEIYAKVPDIQKIDESLSKLGINLIKSALRSPGEDLTASFQAKNSELLRMKKCLLVEHGYPLDYLDVHYDCPICKDTGFINDLSEPDASNTIVFSKSKPCKCFQQNLINLAYKQSNLKNVLELENFNTFKFDYYSGEVDPAHNNSPLSNMKRIYEMCVDFVEQFSTQKRNILFHGPTGLGKTFLCNCIAKEILDLGHSVLYLSAQELFKLFEESRFHRDDMGEESKHTLNILFTVDLLIIDDFGTESNNSFTGPDLFRVINTRYLNQKSTIISTNLPIRDWKTLYSERIISRIFGEYSVFRVFGEDIRLMKKYHKKAT